MSYRIQIAPAAGSPLRNLNGPVREKLGHLLAELAEMTPAAPPRTGKLRRLDVDGCTLFYEVDRRERTLTVRQVERRDAA